MNWYMYTSSSLEYTLDSDTKWSCLVSCWVRRSYHHHPCPIAISSRHPNMAVVFSYRVLVNESGFMLDTSSAF